MRGVDVSIYNYPVDWHALKDAGIDFAICAARVTANRDLTKLFNATSTVHTALA